MRSIKEDWDSAALAYEQFNGAEDSYSYNIEWPCIQALLPALEGKTVLDLGCGTGIFTFLLEKYQPKKLIGLDLSEEMLRIARQKAEALGSRAQFIMGDAAQCGQLIAEPVDFIFSSTTTHYIENLPRLFEQIVKCLIPGGNCVLSVIHPVYSAMYPIERGERFPKDEEWTVRYLDRRKRAYIQPWIEYNDAYENRLSRSFHHTFGDYISAIIGAGLKIEALREPLPPAAWRESQPYRYESFVETPTYMILKLAKGCEEGIA